MTKPSAFTTLPDTTDISGFIAPLVDPTVTQYRTNLHRFRGTNVINVTDHGVVGDGTTDNRTKLQAIIDANESANAMYTLYFPQGIYRVVPVAGIGLTSNYKVSVIGEGFHMGAALANAGSVIYMDSTTANDVLWLFTNALDSTSHLVVHYNCIWMNIAFRASSPTTANQHCFQIGNGVGTADAHQWQSHNVSIRDFSGLCYRIVHVNNVATTYAFSSASWTGAFHLDNVGGLFGIVNTGAAAGEGSDKVVGTGTYFQNIHVFNGGWNETSPWPYQFDFTAFREIQIDLVVVEGGGLVAPAAESGIFLLDGEGWYYINGFHYEQGGTAPTYSIRVNDTINFNGTRHVVVNGSWGMFGNNTDRMLLGVCDTCNVELNGVRPNSGGSAAMNSDDLIAEPDTINGSWIVTFRNFVTSSSGNNLYVIPQHIGRVRIDGAGSAQQSIQYRDSEMTLAEYSSAKDGWCCGLPSTIAATNKLGGQYAQFFIEVNSGPVYEEIGMVNDPTEGRVFAVRASASNHPFGTFNFTLPAEYLNDANGVGAQVSMSVRWRYIHQEGINQLLRWDGTATATWENIAGYNMSVASVDADAWYSTAMTALVEGTGTSIFRPTGSDAVTAPTELRISHVKMALGGMIPSNYGGGSLVSTTANQMRPLRWPGELPTWGDYIDGDHVDNIAPAVASPQGWICTTAGALASAWTITTVYAIGDWVENGGNVYKCTVAGTSAGSGGPTGTGTGIIDNTVTWDFHDTLGVWTAKANL